MDLGSRVPLKVFPYPRQHLSVLVRHRLLASVRMMVLSSLL